MKNYVDFVERTNNETSPYGIDSRAEPKYELPNGEISSGSPWCRP